METQPTAPPVVAVVVTCDPGPWFEEALASLGDQDYPNLSVLVVDAASTVDPTERVAAVAPDAFVRRLDRRVGYGTAANEVLDIVDGASHYLFCHDDVALGSSAVRLMVEEAFRSNAGIISPKLVEWERPDRLLAVGVGADRQGILHPLVEPGELDQEQHDAVRDVFVAPGGAALVRSDLFASLGGYRSEIDQFGEDLDLSWRAQLAGARIVVAPAARVRHLQAERSGRRAGWTLPADRRRSAWLTEQHRIRTVLTCYGPFRLLRVLPLMVLYVLGEALWQLVRGHAGEAGATLRAPWLAFRPLNSLLNARRSVRRLRRTSDRDAGRLQTHGNVRLRGFVRSLVQDGPLPGIPVALGDEEAEAMAVRPPGRERDRVTTVPPEDADTVTSEIGRGSWRLPVAYGVGLLIVFLVGSRSLWGHDLPAVGQFPVTTGGVGRWWHLWWSNTSRGGLGGTVISAPGVGMLALAGTVLFGAVGTLQHVVVLGTLVVGPIGAYRATRWFGSLRGRVAAMIVYALVPLPYNALAGGRWPALLAYAAAPWVLGMIARLSAEIPFPPSQSRHLTGRVVGLGLVTALVGAFAPSWLLVVPGVGIALYLGSLLAEWSSASLRLIAVPVVGSVVALVLLAPWSLKVLGDRTDTFGVFGGSAARLGLGDVLRFHTGPIGSQPLGWALLAAAALPLVIGRGWRLAWAARLWIVALACFGATWAGLRGWVPLPAPEIVLAPAAAALAGSVGLGAVAFELDLPGYSFGWRQAASGLAAAAVIIGSIPVLIGAVGGHWKVPTSDATQAVGFLSGGSQPDYRVLWVGAPSALPLSPRPYSGGNGLGTVFSGSTDVSYLWSSDQVGPVGRLAGELQLSSDRRTTTLGHLLAPMGVRYIVVPNHNAPSGSGAAAVPQPQALLAGLSQQTDLLPESPDTNYTIYVNAAWRGNGPAAPLHSSAGRQVAALIEFALWVLAVAILILDRRRRAVSRVVEAVRPEWFVPMSPASTRRGLDPSGSRSGLSLGESDYDPDEMWVDD